MADTPLSHVRLAAKKTQKEVAAALGIDLSHYYRIERAEVGASREVAKRISAFFGGAITPAEILYPEDYPYATPVAPSGEAA